MGFFIIQLARHFLPEQSLSVPYLEGQNISTQKFILILCFLGVKNVARQGVKNLQVLQTGVDKLATQTSLSLKQNVYKNYSQFIETAKEISSV